VKTDRSLAPSMMSLHMLWTLRIESRFVSEMWPNLFLVGAPRSGTTALYEYLAAHPDVFMSPAKEPGFLAAPGSLYDLERRRQQRDSYFITSIDDYRLLFRHRSGERLVGEATPHYLHDPRVPPRIAHYCREAKILVSLRSPAARSHSAHMMEVRDGAAGNDFAAALMHAVLSPDRPAMLAASFYAEALRRFFDHLGRDRVLVLLHEDLHSDLDACLTRVWEFLEIDATFRPSVRVRPNRSGVPRSRRVHDAVMRCLDHRRLRRLHLHGPKGLSRRLEAMRNLYFAGAVVPRALDRRLERDFNRAFFRSDIQATEELIGRDLSHWLE
jgi:hypothetical protein